MIIAEVTKANLRYTSSEILQKNIESMDALLFKFVNFSYKIKTISKYPESARNLAFDKFMEIHDELLVEMMTAKNEEEAKAYQVLLKYLNRHINKSSLIKKKPYPSFVRWYPRTQ